MIEIRETVDEELINHAIAGRIPEGAVFIGSDYDNDYYATDTASYKLPKPGIAFLDELKIIAKENYYGKSYKATKSTKVQRKENHF